MHDGAVGDACTALDAFANLTQYLDILSMNYLGSLRWLVTSNVRAGSSNSVLRLGHVYNKVLDDWHLLHGLQDQVHIGVDLGPACNPSDSVHPNCAGTALATSTLPAEGKTGIVLVLHIE